MKIWNHDVGPGRPVFIVAEGGSCHGGSLDAALALTDAAADAGANAMKWQLWLSADEMYDKQQFTDEYMNAQKWQLPKEWLPQLRDRAHERGMAVGLSSFGFASLEEADKWVDFHKVASIEATWGPFVAAAARSDKPMLISTGGMDKAQANLAANVAHDAIHGMRLDRGSPLSPDCGVVILQCAIAYPCPVGEADLRALEALSMSCGNRVGYSDHTTHPTIAPCAAVSLGACVIEKHIRGSRNDYPGGQEFSMPDWLHSLAPWDFKKMVHAIRQTEQALGSSEKRIRPSEQGYLKYRRGPRGLRGA